MNLKKSNFMTGAVASGGGILPSVDTLDVNEAFRLAKAQYLSEKSA